MTSILVVGAQGQVARSLCEEAAGRPLSLTALGRPDLDLTEPESLNRAMDTTRPDVVINAAAYTNVDAAEDDEAAAYALNCDGPGVLASLCAARDIPLIHISTDYVFDGSKNTPYTENDTPAPLGVYGRSKHEGECAVMAATPKHVIARTAWVYSPFGHNFLKTMLKVARSRDTLNVVDDQIGCPTYAPHIACGLLDIAQQIAGWEADAQGWGIYNMVADGEASWYDFACEIFSCSARHGGPVATVHPIPSAQYPTPTRRPANSRLSRHKLAETFKVSLPDWKAGTAHCIERLLGADSQNFRGTD